ncbi:putative lipid II flippase FtsW [Enemella sp. A6]|uniref:putative lipid II flippase FtsW n=1 Tax=Enemella sp. A6 TaxID=3440152 RepID=UPI003EC0F0DC
MPTANSRRPSTLLRAALTAPMASYYLVLGSVGLLVILGSLMVLSSSSVYALVNTGDSFYFFKRQVIFLVFGVIGAWLISRREPTQLRMLGWIAFFVAVALLALTHSPLGVEIQGNRNWVQLGHPLLRLQPSEFAKLAMVLWGAEVLSRKERVLDQPAQLLVPFLPGGAILTGLVVLQRDLGTAVVMGAIFVGILWLVGANWRVLGVLALGSVAAVAAMVAASPNRMGRFIAFLNPGDDLLGTNMQPTMGLYALASGGWFGVGLGASRQKWGSLREAHTDYIFAVVGEELGLVGAVITLVLFLTLGWAGLRIALRSDSLFNRVVAGGVTVWLMFQMTMNVAVVLRLIPVVGVPLPLVSYGGSALLANLLAVGLLLACARDEPEARIAIKRRRARSGPRMTAVIGR